MRLEVLIQRMTFEELRQLKHIVDSRLFVDIPTRHIRNENLSVRVMNVLMREGVDTVGKVIDDYNLGKTKTYANMGRMSYNDVTELVKRYGGKEKPFDD